MVTSDPEFLLTAAHQAVKHAACLLEQTFDCLIMLERILKSALMS
jgi:hypothetical protein